MNDDFLKGIKEITDLCVSNSSDKDTENAIEVLERLIENRIKEYESIMLKITFEPDTLIVESNSSFEDLTLEQKKEYAKHVVEAFQQYIDESPNTDNVIPFKIK